MSVSIGFIHKDEVVSIYLPVLSAAVYSVKRFSGIEEVLQHSKIQDILIIGIDYGGENSGIELCEIYREDRRFKNALLIILSEKSDAFIRVAALEAGADYYLVLPVNKRVFAAQVNAWANRLQRNADDDNLVIKLNDLEIDLVNYVVRVKGREQELPRKEFAILELLASKPGKVFTRDEIKDTVWSNAKDVRDRTIDVHIRKLRERIGDAHIRTIRGVGYKVSL